MIENRIALVCKKRGIRNASILAKRCRFSTNTAYPLYSGAATGIDFKTLNTLCSVLRAKPSDLFAFIKDKESEDNGNQQESIQSYQPLNQTKQKG